MNEIETLKNEVRRFRDERGWGKHHTPKNLAQALASEVGELNDLYLWDRRPCLFDVRDEMADIMIYLLHLSDATGLNLFEAVLQKVQKNDLKYPVDMGKEKY
jgi:NTP pyrophosphatase (non-canonical NTP hydrolase)